MQIFPSSVRNTIKLSPTIGLSATTTDSTVQPIVTSRPEKIYYKSRIRTGLTPRIEHRALSSDYQCPETESPRTSIPSKDFKSHTGLLDQGIHIRKLSINMNNTSIKLSKFLNRQKEKKQSLVETSKETLNETRNEQSPFRDSFLVIQKSKLSMVEIQIRQKRGCRTTFKRVPMVEQGASLKKIVQIKQKNPQKVEKVPIKEAVHDKDWVNRAKPQILKSFMSLINKSNGMSMELPNDNFFYYKYYLGRGNNSNLIKQCLSSRWWWVRVGKEEIGSANLVWTQWKEKKFMNTLPKLNVSHNIESTLPISITTNVRFQPADSHIRPRLVNITPLGYNLITRSKSFGTMKPLKFSSADLRLCNKLEHNFHLSNKKALFFNMKCYYDRLGLDVFNIIPVTFHIKSAEDPAYADFEACFKNYEELTDEYGRSPANVWIVKPGENSNRGNGISVCMTLDSIKTELKSNPHPITGAHTFIIQKYIERPFLINKRKFDIRCFCLISSFNHCIQGYFYSEGYLRTASKNFSLQINNKFVHLTNDAVQKHSDDYGKYENGNKLSYYEFQKYLDQHIPEKNMNFVEEIVPQIKNIVRHTIEATFSKLDPHNRGHSFEVFGYDFLIDSDLKPWLLEVNTNPCLELSSPLLSKIIPAMIENALKICIDPIHQEPYAHSKRLLSSNTGDLCENKFELIFHSVIEGPSVNSAVSDLNQQEIDELSNESEEDKESGSEEI